MISQKQLEANRRNSQRSSGPKTEGGKKVSALNARRHNLTGQVTALTDLTETDGIMHDAFSASIIESLAPKGAMETQLAQRIAADSWRLNRISAVEDNLFALGHDAKSDEIETPDSDNAAEIHAALTAAKVFKAESKPPRKREAEMNEAKELLKLNE